MIMDEQQEQAYCGGGCEAIFIPGHTLYLFNPFFYQGHHKDEKYFFLLPGSKSEIIDLKKFYLRSTFRDDIGQKGECQIWTNLLAWISVSKKIRSLHRVQ